MFKQKEETNSRSNSDGTMTWKEKTKANPRQQKMRSSLMNTKETGDKNVYQGVLFPGEEEPTTAEKHEWLAENLVDFHSDLCILYQMLTTSNPEWQKLTEKPSKYHHNNGYPSGVKYMWKEHKSSEPQELKVELYATKVLEWVEEQIADENVFPSDADVEFPPDFQQKFARKIFKRLFRVFAIIWEHPCISGEESVGAKRSDGLAHLVSCFKRFMYFAWEWNLLEENETKCIAAVIKPLRERFEKERDSYEAAH